MTVHEAAEKIIEAVASGKLGKLSCEERLEMMEAKGRAGQVLTPFTAAEELLACCALVRTFLATYAEPITQADRDIARYNALVRR